MTRGGLSGSCKILLLVCGPSLWKVIPLTLLGRPHTGPASSLSCEEPRAGATEQRAAVARCSGRPSLSFSPTFLRTSDAQFTKSYSLTTMRVWLTICLWAALFV
jgi:hypothetical protein